MAFVSENEFCCPVCHEVYRDPVVLSCSHSFCKDCLKRCWREKDTRECPLCRRRSSKEEPPSNLALKNLCEAFVQERNQKASEGLCSLHSEKLKLFCLDHQQPVCVVCINSENHLNHRFRPIDEAAQLHKKELQERLKYLKTVLSDFKERKVMSDQAAKYIKVQVQHTERQIKETFKKLHQFLEEEEEARMAALREEEEQKSQMMKEKLEALSRDMAALSDTVRATEDELRAEDVSFLLNYKAAVERVQRPLLDPPQLPSGALIDQAKHLGNLTFNIWSKMKDMVSYTPVVLDPNSALLRPILCVDLTSVRRGEEQQLPDNPRQSERLHKYCGVLGSEGFTSGTHSWDVKVEDSTLWEVGVVAESAYKKGDTKRSSWGIKFSKGRYRAWSPSPVQLYLARPFKDYTDVYVQETRIKIIRVNLDLTRGELSFSDPTTNTHLHTFKHNFTERMFPFINTDGELNIVPMTVDVTLKQKQHLIERIPITVRYRQKYVQ